jgi:glyoxylase-like metal-dependent hydrolase (beta-lactamase superfamily II)
MNRHLAFGLAAAVASAMSGSARADVTVEPFVAGPDGFHVVSTLILGDKGAVLVDAQLTRSEAHRVVARVLESRRELTTVYITHAHPDHYFGLEVIKQAFPKAKILAAPVVVTEMKQTAGGKEKAYRPIYGANLGKPVFPTAYRKNTIELDGQTIELIPLEPGESAAAVLVHVPAAKTVIAGDVVFDHVHPWMAETDAARRAGWLKNLEKIRSLSPTTVIAGHRTPEVKDAMAAVDFTAAYVADYDKAVNEAKSADELKKKMLANPRYRELKLPAILDLGVATAFLAPPAAPTK